MTIPFFHKYVEKFKSSGLRAHLIKASSGSFVLKLSLMFFNLLISVVMARLLGSKGFGIYVYCISIINLLLIPATLGFPNLLVREIAAYRSQKAWGLMRGLIWRANSLTFFLSLFLASGAALCALIMAERFSSQALNVFLISLILLPLLALNKNLLEILRGIKHIVLGQFPNMFLRPAVFLAFLAAVYIFATKEFDVQTAMWFQVLATCLTFIGGLFWLWKRIPPNAKSAKPTYDTKVWLLSALPLLLAQGMGILISQADIIMLGAFRGAEAVGIYTVAKRGADLVSIGIFAANMALGPTISSLYAEKDMQRLQRVVTKSARIVLIITLPIASSLIVFAPWILSNIFGHEFVSGATALSILSVGQLFNAGMGSVGLLLIMTGHERENFISVAIAALVNVILNAFFIPIWGVNGAAVATGISIAMWHILLAVWVVRRTSIHATALGCLS